MSSAMSGGGSSSSTSAAAEGDAAQAQHADLHSLIAPSDDVSMKQQEALARLQATFRGRRDRETHVERARLGVPVCPFLRTPPRVLYPLTYLPTSPTCLPTYPPP